MEIILKEDVVNLGYKNDIVTVKQKLAQPVLSSVLLVTSRSLRNWLNWVTRSTERSSL